MIKQPRIKFLEDARPAMLTHKGDSYLIMPNGKGELVVGKGKVVDGKFNEPLYTHTQINAAATPETQELNSLLTKRNGLWEGSENTSEGTKNRFFLSNILQFPDNIDVDTRIEMLKEHIQDKVYGANNFNRVDVQALWLSFLAQVTNDGLRDNKAQGRSEEHTSELQSLS